MSQPVLALGRRRRPLDPDGEMLSWAIVESRAGSRNVRAIAAVKNIGVSWPGAGTLRQVFSKPDANGRAVVDEVAWLQAQERERRARLSC